MKKLRIMILLIILSFSFFLMSYLKRRNYELTYNLNEFKVTERYIKNDEKYYINIKHKKNEYFFILDSKYSRKRKLVSKPKIVSDGKYKCLVINFNNKVQSPSCITDNGYVSYHIINESRSDDDKTIITIATTYKNINIKTLYNKKILIWNYHGFYYLSNDKNKEIKLFDNDTYNASLIGQIDKYLILPNYNESYEYKSFKILNIDDMKVKTLDLKNNLSEDSYVLGINNDSIFYYDKKHHQEFEFVPYKNKYRLVNNYIYENGKKVDKSDIYLSNNETKFKYDVTYSYGLIDNKLYRYNKYNKYKELITDLVVSDIVKENNDEVYFISNDKLYVYNDKYSTIELLEYFELNFNYNNIFYIFD